jgi:hypothetical protein
LSCVKEVLTATLRWADRSMDSFNGNRQKNSSKYATVIRAVIESAAVTWIGIVLAEIGMLAPTGHITVCAFFVSWVVTEETFRRTKTWDPLYSISYPISS